MSPTPGLLYVTMQPPQNFTRRFHDWYNNEHGPTRLRYPQIFANGFRYRAIDGETPEWLALYDVHDMSEMLKDPYVSLRKPPIQSQRERDVIQKIDVDRRFWDLLDTHESGDFRRLEDVECEGEGNVIVTLRMRFNKNTEKALQEWYRTDHIETIKKVGGWRRSRRYLTSTVDDVELRECLIIHEFSPKNELNGNEYKKAVDFSIEVYRAFLVSHERRTYELHYTFGPAPRYLTVPSDMFTSTDGKTSVADYAIESYITTPDGVDIEYNLEGSKEPNAPLIVLCNSILVNYGIWNSFIRDFHFRAENTKYRILMYNTRGRYAACGGGGGGGGDRDITIDSLADDVICLLNALRVKKAAAIIGVSMGGATALNLALRYPQRVESFISCDTNSNAPASNKKAWGERIEMAEKDNTPDDTVGESLAEATVRRWFVKESYDGGEMEKEVQRVKDMVKSNSLSGFKKSVNALYEYDMREVMKGCKVKGAFFVGSGDGVLPETMKKMADEFNGGGGRAKFVVIDGAGHLPMAEKPMAFADEVTNFLNYWNS